MDCIFCKIAAGDVAAVMIYEDDRIVAFHDIQPAAPVHALIIPRKHIASINDAEQEDLELLGHLLGKAQAVAEKLGVAETGYRLLNNCGEDAGQVVHHLHFHLLGGKKLSLTH